MAERCRIVVAPGDGVGPEITAATLQILQAAGTPITWDTEAVHGSAPDIAGKNIANPCALMLGAAMMLAHLGMQDRAKALRAAIVDTIVCGDPVTPDLGGTGHTESFADAIIERLGRGKPAA